MTTATKRKTPSRKSAAVSPAQQMLALARQKADEGATWIEMHNALYGIGGLLGRHFKSTAERAAYMKSPEHAEVAKLIEAAPEGEGLKRPEASGKLLVRIPKSLHAALIVEAEAEETSINQLVVAKLSAQLRAVV